MKKILGLLLVGCLSIGTIGAVAEDSDIKADDLNYYWNFKEKKCSKMLFADKAAVIKDYKNKYLIANRDYINDAGRFMEFLGEYEDQSEFTMVIMSTYGECRFYEDLVIKNLDVKAIQYAKVKTTADKPAALPVK